MGNEFYFATHCTQSLNDRVLLTGFCLRQFTVMTLETIIEVANKISSRYLRPKDVILLVGYICDDCSKWCKLRVILILNDLHRIIN